MEERERDVSGCVQRGERMDRLTKLALVDEGVVVVVMVGSECAAVDGQLPSMFGESGRPAKLCDASADRTP